MLGGVSMHCKIAKGVGSMCWEVCLCTVRLPREYVLGGMSVYCKIAKGVCAGRSFYAL